MISPRVVPDDGVSVLSLVRFGVPGSNFDPQLRMNAMCFDTSLRISRGDTGICEPQKLVFCLFLRRCVP